jgi:N4-gp56 family major capsid protein
MAYASYGVNDALAVKLWAKQLAKAERLSLDLSDLMGESENSIIQIKKETTKGKGDKVTYALATRLTGRGIGEGMAADGNGEALSTFSDALFIGELGHVVGVPSDDTIDAQRVPFDIRAISRDRMANWWKDRKAVSFTNHVCGNTAQTDSFYTGLNATTAPSGDGNTNIRQIWAGTNTVDQTIGSGDTFTVALVDKAVQYARSGNNMIRPVMLGGQAKYVLYLHEAQITQLRTNTGSNGWLDIHRTALAGAEVSKSPIYNNSMGEWNGCIIRRSQDITQGCNASTPTTAVANTRRAVLLGAQAAVIAFGTRTSGGDKYRWNEELKDHKRKLEVSAWSIWGLKKAVYNSVDHGALVISTYSAV